MDDKMLVEKLGFNRVLLNQSMSDHTYMKVGGVADFLYEAKSTNELINAVKFSISAKIPYTVIGNGANVLVSDKGIKGLVILNKTIGMRILPHGFVEIESGVDNSSLIKSARERNLSGAERLLKVPGTIGGAIYMNAGDTGKNNFFGELIISVDVVNNEGHLETLTNDQCEFSYRSSRFQKSGEVILKAKIHLTESTKEMIEESVRDILVRKMHHPAGASVGSTFKNPDSDHAGRLIEECGLKGKRIGHAKISEKHANFIINEGGATASDVRSLIDLMKSSVKEKFGVDLQEEVRYLGIW